MNATIDLRVLELLCSRLCHDLISPVSAINNGMELLAEGDADMAADIQSLLATSASSASAKLQFYRIAYGLGGQNVRPVGLAEAGRLARGLVESEKVSIDWRAEDGRTEEPTLTREQTKLLLNLVLLGIEALPRGGTITVEAHGAPAGEVVVAANGAAAGLKPESAEALTNGVDIEALTARTVQGYFVARLAGLIGAVPVVERAGPDSITLRVPIAA